MKIFRVPLRPFADKKTVFRPVTLACNADTSHFVIYCSRYPSNPLAHPKTATFRALAERAYPDLSGDANRFTPAEHPEDWFAALLRDIFRRQRHGS